MAWVIKSKAELFMQLLNGLLEDLQILDQRLQRTFERQIPEKSATAKQELDRVKQALAPHQYYIEQYKNDLDSGEYGLIMKLINDIRDLVQQNELAATHGQIMNAIGLIDEIKMTVSYTIQSQSDIADDLASIDQFVDHISSIISPTQFWAAIEGAKTNHTPEDILNLARQEAQAQGLESPDNFTWNDIDDYLEVLIVHRGETYDSIRQTIEEAYPQVLGSK